jgi:hypothetical protein
VKHHERDRVHKLAEKFARDFVNQYLRFPPVTDEDRDTIGVNNPDPTRTSQPAPDTVAIINGIEPLLGHRIRIRFHDEKVEEGRARPKGYNGCLLSFVVGDERVDDPALLTRTALMTRSPWTLELTPQDEKKWLSCAVQWQNAKGELGAWSEVQHMVVG